MAKSKIFTTRTSHHHLMSCKMWEKPTLLRAEKKKKKMMLHVKSPAACAVLLHGGATSRSLKVGSSLQLNLCSLELSSVDNTDKAPLHNSQRAFVCASVVTRRGFIGPGSQRNCSFLSFFLFYYKLFLKLF